MTLDEQITSANEAYVAAMQAMDTAEATLDRLTAQKRAEEFAALPVEEQERITAERQRELSLFQALYEPHLAAALKPSPTFDQFTKGSDGRGPITFVIKD